MHQNQNLHSLYYLSVGKSRQRPEKEEKKGSLSRAPKTVLREDIGIRKDNLIPTSEAQNLSVFKHTQKRFISCSSHTHRSVQVSGCNSAPYNHSGTQAPSI